MSYQRITLTVDDGIAVLTLNQPQTLNALSTPLQEEMRDALAGLRDHGDARALIITGAGRAFSSGADLNTMDPPQDRSLGEQVSEMMRTLSNPMIEDIRDLPIPVISAVNGPAAGAGASVALAADLVIAAEDAYFLFPFVPTLGIVPDMGATWHLPRLLGNARALGLTLLGERLPAARAAQWGLIWAAVNGETLMAEAQALAARLAALPAGVAGQARRILDDAAQRGLGEQMEEEARVQQGLIDSEAFQEGVRAFQEKRRPDFS